MKIEKKLDIYSDYYGCDKTFYFVKIPYLTRKLSKDKNIGFESLREASIRKATEEEIKNSKKIINRVKHLLEKEKMNGVHLEKKSKKLIFS